MRSQSYIQSQTYRTIPVQIQASSILNMNVVELQQFVENEAAENPAMTLKESCRCPVCGFLTTGKACPICKSSMRSSADSFDSNIERDYLKRAFTSAATDGLFDPFRTVSNAFDLKDYLRQQVGMVLSGHKLQIANFIIDSLDDDGYFRETLFEISEEVASYVLEVEEVLTVIQQCDPPGIAARDLQECLLLQLDAINNEQTEQVEIARIILREHWDEFSKMKIKSIATSMDLDAQVLGEAIDYIREQLNPYPASVYHDPNESLSSSNSTALIPDVIVREQDGVLFAEVAGTYESIIGTDETYQGIYNDIREQDNNICEDDRKHVKEHVDRVRIILDSIQRRKKTLSRISQYIVDYQEEYIRFGPAYMKSIKQKEIAAEMEVDESTVSRALAGKYCRLPSGEVISFDVFFDAALPVKDMILKIVTESREPLSDSEIARRLSENGFNIARRTVAKYREQMKMLPVQLRNIL